MEEYRKWVFNNTASSNTGNGINTVHLNGEVKHITELDDLTLCNEWSKLIRERNELYNINKAINAGWRGFILRLIGVSLPDRKNVFIKGIDAKGDSIYPQ
ncbi:TPA: hypothetical protein L4592_005874 [Pseudomonas aeruginosa]|nr:hypothetical protein [Salmonella enterica]EEY1775183.1 hypothetical protein [Escherichia coli]HBO5663890.1 hypothetical protein [Pseudomonas aeruginosa]